jgi:CheY-like chemotaxis protein
VRAVYSGEEVVEVAQSFQPDMLICDVMMSGITGIEAAINVRAELPSCQILLFSGQAATLDLLEEARNRGYSFGHRCSGCARTAAYLCAARCFG